MQVEETTGITTHTTTARLTHTGGTAPPLFNHPLLTSGVETAAGDDHLVETHTHIPQTQAHTPTLGL